MPTTNDDLKKRLSRNSEITISVTGRKSGRTISIPIWFVSDDENLYLLPVQGSDTQWYKNVVSDPSIHVAVQDVGADFKAVSVTDAAGVSSVVEKFRGKYHGDVKKYYSKFDAAIVIHLA